MLKNSFILLAASLPIIGYSDDTVDSGQSCCPLIPSEPVESCQLPVGYFWPAQYTFGDCCAEISVSGQFLYWEVNRDSECSLGTKNEFVNNGLAQVQTTLVHHQGYRPGFKVAVGMGIPQFDNWEFNAEYTWFHHESTNHFTTTPNGFITVGNFLFTADPPLFVNSPASSLRSKVLFNLDFLQATVGRSMYLSQRWMINLSVGLKSWWSSLHTDLRFNLLSGLPGTQLTKSNLWGIGPYAKIQLKALLWCGVYAYGGAGIWPPYTRFTKLHTNTNFPGVGPIPAFANVEKFKTFFYTTQLFYEGAAGLGWGTYLCDCDYHIDFTIGYDIMTTYVRGEGFELGSPHKEFYYQGLTVKAQFDF